MEPLATSRVFQSPELETGKTYYYVVKAEWLNDGKPVEKTETLEIRAGETAVANFTVNK